MYVVYILRTSGGTLYTGQTNNLPKRLEEHKSKKTRSSKYMRAFKSFELVYQEKFPTRSEAMKREFEIKKLTKERKEDLIRGDKITLKNLKRTLMKIFITASFKEGNKAEIEQLCSMVRNAGFEDFWFHRDVEKFKKVFDNPRELMERAKKEILNCDAILFDATEQSTGKAIEVGVAFANKKKVIVIMEEGTEIKETLRGVADIVITYDKIEDIRDKLVSAFR